MSRRRIQGVAALCLAALLLACAGGAWGQAMHSGAASGIDPGHPADTPGRIRVFPLLFLSREASLPERDAAAAWAKLTRMLAHSQAHFRHLLRTDTFAIEPNPRPVYRSTNPHSHFFQAGGKSPDSAHLMLRELLAHFGETRESTRRVYVAVYVRHPKDACGKGTPVRPCLGGGRSIDALPVPGGGIVQLEYQSLETGWSYPFQSTLTHEIGHGFGLTHVDCLGYDMRTNDSIMSYNTSHHRQEGVPGEFPGTLNPEEYALLSLHTQAFPDFRYDPARHNPGGTLRPNMMQCTLGPMDASLGLPPTRGYRLYYDGKLVSGKEAALWTFQAAVQNCRWNRENRPGVAVTCTYGGTPLSAWEKRIPTK